MINIFFGSSLLNEQSDKEALEVFIRKLNVEFSTVNKLVDIHIKPLFKNELNLIEDLIKKAEYTFFILFRNVSDNENDEIDLAVKSFEENNRPKVYVYFKNILDGDTIEDSITKLQNKIAVEFKHYYQTFSNIDEIKLRLVENVFSDKLKDSLVYEDSTIKFEGIDLSKYIDYNVMPEFKNNEELNQIKQEYEELLTEYNKELTKENADDFFALEKINAKKEILRQKIKDKEEKILSLSIKLIELKNKDLKNENIKEAIKLFEQGNMKGCIEALNLSRTNKLIKEAYSLKDKAMFEQDQAKYNITWAIKEKRIIIDLLIATDNIENKDDMILELFRENATLAIDFDVEFDEAFNYVEYLLSRGKLDSARDMLDSIEEIVSEKSERKYPLLYAKLYNLFGLYNSTCSDFDSAIDYFNDSLDYYKMQEEKEGSEEYLYGLYKNNLYIGQTIYGLNQKNSLDKVLMYYSEAIDACEALCEINFKKYSFDLAKVYMQYTLLPSVKIDKKYEGFFIKYVDYQKENNSNKRNNEKLADALSLLGNYYLYNGSQFDAEKYFLEAISYYDSLNVISTSELKQKISNTHNQLMLIKQNLHEFDKALYHQEKAYEYMKAAFKENSLYAEIYFTIAFNLFVLYNDIDPAKGYQLLDECNNLIDKLYEKHKEKISEFAILFYSNICIIYVESGNIDSAYKYYLKYTNILNSIKEEDINYLSYNYFYGYYSSLNFNLNIRKYQEGLDNLISVNKFIDAQISLDEKESIKFFAIANTISTIINTISNEFPIEVMQNEEYVNALNKFYELFNVIIINCNVASNQNDNVNFLNEINQLAQNSVNMTEEEVASVQEEIANKLVMQFEKSLETKFTNKSVEYNSKIKGYSNFIVSSLSSMIFGIDTIEKYFVDAIKYIIKCNNECPNVNTIESNMIISYYIECIGVKRSNKDLIKEYIDSEFSKFEYHIKHISYTHMFVVNCLAILEKLYKISSEKECVVKYIGKIYQILNTILKMSDGKINKKVEAKLLEFNANMTGDVLYHQNIVELLYKDIFTTIDDDIKVYFINSINEVINYYIDEEKLDLLEEYTQKAINVINILIDNENETVAPSLVDLLYTLSDLLDSLGVKEGKEFLRVAKDLEEKYNLNNDSSYDDFMNMFNF